MAQPPTSDFTSDFPSESPNLGDRLRHVWEASELRQEDFAVKLGVTTVTLQNYFKNKRLPSSEFIKQTCVLFSVSPEWLVLGSGSMQRNQAMLAPEPGQNEDEKTPRTQAVEEGKAPDEMEALRRENRELRQENRELRQESREIQRTNRELVKENADLRVELAKLEARAAPETSAPSESARKIA